MDIGLARLEGGRVHSRLTGLIAGLVFGLDALLRQWLGVYEYSTDPECIFRIRIVVLTQPITLSDGTGLRPGERLIDLHLWNEHVPIIPPEGATLRWAHRMYHCLDLSLRELTDYLEHRADLDDVCAVRAELSFGTHGQVSQLTRLSTRFGFEAVGDPWRHSLTGRLHLLGENVLVSLLVIARNAVALRSDSLLRTRVQVLLSRATLERRYGDALSNRIPAYRRIADSASTETSRTTPVGRKPHRSRSHEAATEPVTLSSKADAQYQAH